jgi:hypothetical protein
MHTFDLDKLSEFAQHKLQDFYQYLLQKYSEETAQLHKNKATTIAPRLVKPFTPFSRDTVYER